MINNLVARRRKTPFLDKVETDWFTKYQHMYIYGLKTRFSARQHELPIRKRFTFIRRI